MTATLRGALVMMGFVAIAASTARGMQSNGETKIDKARRPSLVLRIDRGVALAPARVMLVADLIGGEDDYQDFYCPTIEWDWGDGTHSQSSADCQPYEPRVSQIVRHFSMTNVFQEGAYAVKFRLKREDKELVSTTARLMVR